MDMTLRTYLDLTDKTYNIILNTENITKSQIKVELFKLEDYIRRIQTVSYKIATVYNTCRKLTNDKINDGTPDNIEHIQKIRHKKKKKQKEKTQKILKFDQPESALFNTDLNIQDKFKEVAPGVRIYTKQVETTSELPNQYIYWVKSINKFAIKINGTVLEGGIGEIYNKSKNPIGAKKCCRDMNCKGISGECKYYHSTGIRNWTNSSWLYTSDSITKSNLELRHFGSKSELYNDLQTLKSSLLLPTFLKKYKEQTIHDILVMLASITIYPI